MATVPEGKTRSLIYIVPSPQLDIRWECQFKEQTYRYSNDPGSASRSYIGGQMENVDSHEKCGVK